MGLHETITDSNTQNEHGIEQEIEFFAKLGWTIELRQRRETINSWPQSSLRKLLGKNQVNPYFQGKS